MLKKSKRKTKSPIKQPPLRQAGQSVKEDIESIIDEKVYMWLFIGAWAIMLAVFEWFAWFLALPRSPLLFTAIPLLVVPYCIWKLVRIAHKLRDLNLGLEGEKAVGQYLDEQLTPLGYRVFHDLVFEDQFNIDHVAVGPGGIFCIETKTHSKPIRGQAQIVFQSQSILINGMKPERDPIIQVKAAASTLRATLEDITGTKYFVKPVLLYPGWYVENKNGYKSVWVLEPKAFSKFVANQRQSLGEEDVVSISSFLKQLIVNDLRANKQRTSAR